MPRVDLGVLNAANNVLLAVGALVLLGYILWLWRSGEGRNPLDRLQATGDGPGILEFFAAYFGLMVVFFVAAPLVGIHGGKEIAPGSREWHLGMLLQAGCHFAFSGLAIWLLSRTRSFRTPAPGKVGTLKAIPIGLAAMLAATPILALQLAACTLLWDVFTPGVPAPMHSALTGLEDSQWGDWGMLQIALTATVAAPIYEELVFRGLLLQMLWKYIGRAWPAVIISGLCFGLIHMSVPQSVLPLATFGIILAYLRLRHGSLWLCIVCHACFNARTIVMALLNPESMHAGF